MEETAESAAAGDVGTADTEDAAPLALVPPEPEPALVVRVRSEPEQVRIGGQAGVRVTHLGGVVSTKRVTGTNDDSDHKAVPNAVLAEVRAVIDDAAELPPPAAADVLRAVRDLLAPWL